VADIREADAFHTLLDRARRARAAKEAADAEWKAVEADLRGLADRGGLTPDQESEVAELLAPAEVGHQHHRQRWRPAPS
jgi:hypothetical protein